MSGWTPPAGPAGGPQGAPPGPPPAPPPGPVPTPPAGTGIKPGTGWYWLGGVLIGVAILGGLAIIGLSVIDMFNKVDDFDRVDAAGGPVEISEPGDYTIYHEYPGADSSLSRRTPSVTLTGPDGQVVTLERYDADVNYGTWDHDGVALYSFEAEQAGVYELSADAANGEFAVGEGLGSGLVVGVVVGVLFGVVFFVVGLVIVIITAVRRGKAKRALRPTAPPPGSWGPPPGGGARGAPPPPGGAPPPPPGGGSPPPPPPPPSSPAPPASPPA